MKNFLFLLIGIAGLSLAIGNAGFANSCDEKEVFVPKSVYLVRLYASSASADVAILPDVVLVDTSYSYLEPRHVPLCSEASAAVQPRCRSPGVTASKICNVPKPPT